VLYSPNHNAVLYETDAPLPLLAATEGGRRVNGSMVAIPASLGNLQALAARSMPVIPVMEKDGYDWPIRAPWRPLAHQKITANFLVLHKRCFCLNDMGTMKTLSALWAADYLMEMERRNGRLLRAIISAPLSILRSVWSDALFANFMSRRTYVVLHGSAAKREKLLKQPADFYIINHDGLGVGVSSDRRSPFEGLAAELEARTDIRLAIVDEASVYRDATTKRHRVARKLIASKEYFWLMTGTPTPNGPLDAYGLARLVNGAHGESFQTYKNRVMMPAGPFKWLPRVGSAEAARKLLTPAVRYAIEDCVDLPPCTVQKRDAEMSEAQAKAYRDLKREAVLAMKSGKLVQAVNQAALRIKLIQVACGAVYDGDHESHELDAAPRIAVLEEVIEQCAEKVIVFAPLTNVLNMLYKALHDKFDCAIVNGAVSQDERTAIFRGFQGGISPRVILADPATMAHGLTLTAASCVVWYAPTDKTELYIQANKRIDRPGQLKNTTIVQIAATAVEREIYARLENNESMQGVILKLAEEK
jgi:SNF2 family DNA or RNA helicase